MDTRTWTRGHGQRRYGQRGKFRLSYHNFREMKSETQVFFSGANIQNLNSFWCSSLNHFVLALRSSLYSYYLYTVVTFLNP